MIRDPRVEAACEEEARRRLRLMPISVVPALERLIKDSGHPAHSKALQMILDRFAPAETKTTLTILDGRPPSDAKIEAVLQRIGELASSAGIPLPAPVIEGEVVDVTPSAESTP
jgi:hypothetical protein